MSEKMEFTFWLAGLRLFHSLYVTESNATLHRKFFLTNKYMQLNTLQWYSFFTWL